MLIWTRWGILGVIIPILSGVIASLITSNEELFILITVVIASPALWFIGKKLNVKETKNYIDAKTGENIQISNGGGHTLFWIPLEYWAIIVFVFGVIIQIDTIKENNTPAPEEVSEEFVLDQGIKNMIAQKAWTGAIETSLHNYFGEELFADKELYVIKHEREYAKRLQESIADEAENLGFIVFITNADYSERKRTSDIVAVKESDKLALLKSMNIEAVNYDIGSDQIFQVVKQIDEVADIRFVELDYDTIVMDIKAADPDYTKIVDLVYDFSPDTYQYGSGLTRLETRKEIASTNRIELWWD